MSLIEFYIGPAKHPFSSVRSDAVPRKGEYVSITKVAYLVKRVTWAVDDQGGAKTLRACVELQG